MYLFVNKTETIITYETILVHVISSILNQTKLAKLKFKLQKYETYLYNNNKIKLYQNIIKVAPIFNTEL